MSRPDLLPKDFYIIREKRIYVGVHIGAVIARAAIVDSQHGDKMIHRNIDDREFKGDAPNYAKLIKGFVDDTMVNSQDKNIEALTVVFNKELGQSDMFAFFESVKSAILALKVSKNVFVLHECQMWRQLYFPTVNAWQKLESNKIPISHYLDVGVLYGGTGSFFHLHDAKNFILCGGRGLFGDLGSAFTVSYMAIKSVMDHADNGLTPGKDVSVLKQLIKKHFEVENAMEVANCLQNQNGFDTHEFAGLAQQMAEHKTDGMIKETFAAAGKFILRNISRFTALQAETRRFKFPHKDVMILLVGKLYRSMEELSDGFEQANEHFSSITWFREENKKIQDADVAAAIYGGHKSGAVGLFRPQLKVFKSKFVSARRMSM
uniref:Uncharacterized protein n=1 Tax=Caenorhabditis japonica TaxID=281687 RepID=A0A8R1IN48_CAEJA